MGGSPPRRTADSKHGQAIQGERTEILNREATHLGPGEGRTLWLLAELVTYKVVSEQTGGAYSLFEVVVRPQGGAPPHIQHEGDECAYVLEGEVEFVNEGETLKADVGSLIYAPRGNCTGAVRRADGNRHASLGGVPRK